MTMKKFTYLLSLLACLFCSNTYAQAIYTFAGNGIIGHTDGTGSLLTAEFNHPWGLAFDRKGNLFISDHVNSAIRKITPAGVITTYAGTTVSGYSGDGGP